MRTKTILLSALLGAIGSVSVHAQNVYSLNAVGYINETIYPGYNLISVPLLTSPDQTLNTIMPNGTGTGGPWDGDTLYFFSPTAGYTSTKGQTAGQPTGWTAGGSTNIIAPGTGFWLYSGKTSNVTLTIVGTVPSGPYTNALSVGYNLVSSIVPMSGDLYSNSISAFTNVNAGDSLYVFDPTVQSYTFAYKTFSPGVAQNGGSPWGIHQGGDPLITNVGEAFFYYSGTAPIDWVENYSVSQ